MLAPRLVLVMCLVGLCQGLPDPGRFSFALNSTFEYGGVAKNVFNGTRLTIKVNCNTHGEKVKIGWVVRETQCWNEYAYMDKTAFSSYYNHPDEGLYLESYNISSANYERFSEEEMECEGKITLAINKVGINVLSRFRKIEALSTDPTLATGEGCRAGHVPQRVTLCRLRVPSHRRVPLHHPHPGRC
jgi:hypothetical protein